MSNCLGTLRIELPDEAMALLRDIRDLLRQSAVAAANTQNSPGPAPVDAGRVPCAPRDAAGASSLNLPPAAQHPPAVFSRRLRSQIFTEARVALLLELEAQGCDRNNEILPRLNALPGERIIGENAIKSKIKQLREQGVEIKPRATGRKPLARSSTVPAAPAAPPVLTPPSPSAQSDADGSLQEQLRAALERRKQTASASAPATPPPAAVPGAVVARPDNKAPALPAAKNQAAFVEAGREHIINWAAQRGIRFERGGFDLEAVNKKAVALGLPPFRVKPAVQFSRRMDA